MLIELLVTIAIMALSFIALIVAFSAVELQVGSTADEAQLTTLARQVADIIETQPAQGGGGGIAYVLCSAVTGATYQTELNSAGVTAGTDTVTVGPVAQAQASGSAHVVSPNPSPVALTPISNCGGSAADYGVQQITFRVTSQLGHSLVRIVYKRWN
jgi:hypothetical protein